MLANTTGGLSYQIMKILYNSCVLTTVSYSSPACAGPIILYKWTFECRQIEPLHCAPYKVPQLEPVLAKFKNERSSLRPSSRACKGSDPPRLLLVLFLHHRAFVTTRQHPAMGRRCRRRRPRRRTGTGLHPDRQASHGTLLEL